MTGKHVVVDNSSPVAFDAHLDWTPGFNFQGAAHVRIFPVIVGSIVTGFSFDHSGYILEIAFLTA